MPKYQNKCPQHNELDIYQGCSFNCVYCIAQTTQQPPFELKKELYKITYSQTNNKPYYLSPWTDAYQHEEEKNGYTRQILKALAIKNHPFFVITKSSLVFRDIEYFRNRENTFIAVSLNTLDDEITSVFEPDAPSASQRKTLIEQLVQEKGVKTVVKIDPIIPGITDNQQLDELLGWLGKVQPYAVTADTLRLSKKIVERLSKITSNELISKIMKHYNKVSLQAVHPELSYRIKILKHIASILGRAGVKASFCQASVPECITEFDCRGGYNYDY